MENEQCAEDFSLLQQACDEQSAALAETKVELQLRKEELITVENAYQENLAVKLRNVQLATQFAISVQDLRTKIALLDKETHEELQAATKAKLRVEMLQMRLEERTKQIESKKATLRNKKDAMARVKENHPLNLRLQELENDIALLDCEILDLDERYDNEKGQEDSVESAIAYLEDESQELSARHASDSKKLDFMKSEIAAQKRDIAMLDEATELLSKSQAGDKAKMRATTQKLQSILFNTSSTKLN